jgi:hypothetical protein
MAGLKATMHNPNVSEEAKERAAERIESMGSSASEGPELSTRQAAGYKAALQSDIFTHDIVCKTLYFNIIYR